VTLQHKKLLLAVLLPLQFSSVQLSFKSATSFDSKKGKQSTSFAEQKSRAKEDHYVWLLMYLSQLNFGIVAMDKAILIKKSLSHDVHSASTTLVIIRSEPFFLFLMFPASRFKRFLGCFAKVGAS
jgi:hypothetical protein